MTAVAAPHRRRGRDLVRDLVARGALTEQRLIGVSLMRVIMGLAAVWFYVSDIGRRQLLWGPDAIVSQGVARSELGRGQFSLYLFTDSQSWFELTFFCGLAIAVCITVFGGRTLSVLHAVFILSIYLRNQLVTEGGDNLVSIVILLFPFTLNNAYLAVGAGKRRERLRQRRAVPSAKVLIHNWACALILFQVSVLYVTAGMWKLIGSVWRDGQAMYFISADPQFSTTPIFSDVMSYAPVGWAVCWFTIVIELVFPLAILCRVALVRKAEVISLEGMHVGIMVFMGLVPFGMIMIAADCLALRDQDYLSVWSKAASLQGRWPAARQLKSSSMGADRDGVRHRPGVDHPRPAARGAEHPHRRCAHPPGPADRPATSTTPRPGTTLGCVEPTKPGNPSIAVAALDSETTWGLPLVS